MLYDKLNLSIANHQILKICRVIFLEKRFQYFKALVISFNLKITKISSNST